MGGLAVGIILGVFVAFVGVAALSLSTPLPPRGGEEVATELAPEADMPAEDAAVEAAPAAEQGAGQAADAETGQASAAAATEDDMQPAPAPDAEPEAPADTAPAAAEPAVAEPAAAEPAAAEPAATEPANTAPADTAPADTTPPEEVAPATDIPLPAGTEFNRPPPEPEAALPLAETTPVAALPQAPSLEEDVRAPSLDTAPAAQPVAGSDTPVAPTDIAAPVTPLANPAAETAPAVANSPAILSQPDDLSSPEVETAALAPSAQAGVDPEAPSAAPQTAEAASPEAPEAPQSPVGGDAAADAQAGVEEQETVAVSAPEVPQPLSLPQAGDTAAEDAVAVAGQDETEGAADAESLDPIDQPAIRAFAAEFDAAQTGPLMSVILIDEPESRIEQQTLIRFGFPVAFAIDPLHPDAATRAAAYREAGFEVLILGSMIGAEATAADVEVSFAAGQAVLPEAVAVLDTPDSRIQGDRPVLDAVVDILADTGHGLVAFPSGLNVAEQSANRLGVPGSTVFRLLDDENQRATVITRFLSRAAFTAGQEGSVIVVGHTRPDTVTALFSWALGGRSEGVVLAPLSATLERDADG